MLQEVELKAKKREAGKQISKQIRRNDEVPGVFYSSGVPNINISVAPLALRNIVYTSKVNLINLDVEGKQYKCILKDVSFDPVTDKIRHFDLLGVQDDRKVTLNVPVEFVGQPIGVRKGGTFQKVFHKCKITCLPKHLVSTLQVDVSNLDVAQSVHLRDLNLEGVEYGIPVDSLVCAVQIPRGKAGETLRENAAN